MFALFPQEMITETNGEFAMNFNADLSHPVEVVITPMNDKIINEPQKLTQPYFLVSVNIEESQPKQLTFNGGLGIVNIPSNDENAIIQTKAAKYSDLVKKRWSNEKKKKDRTKKMNYLKKNPSDDQKFEYIDFGVQTNISGIITDDHSQKWKLKAPKRLCLSLIWSFLENCFVIKRSYNEETYDISQLVYLTSAKTYNLIREFLPLPSFQKLYLKFGKELICEKNNIEDITKLSDIIMKYKIDNHILFDELQNNNLAVTLAIDAFAFRSFSTTALTSYSNPISDQNESTVYNNGFLFMMIPIDFRYPPLDVHIEKESSGSYNDNIDKIAKHIKISLICNGFNVWFKATDGDRYPSQEHKDFLNKYISGKSGEFLKLVYEIFNELVDDITLTIPIGDPLHLYKSLRSRYQTHPIKLFSDSNLSTNFEETDLILDIGQALSDVSHLGKMRDCYCLKFFTLENVIKLFKNGKIMDAIFILPIACWIVSIYSTTIDLSFRLFFVELSFQIFSMFFENFTDLKKKKVFQRKQEDSIYVTIHEEQYIIRILNTLVATAITLIFSDFVRTDGLGTHLVDYQKEITWNYWFILFFI